MKKKIFYVMTAMILSLSSTACGGIVESMAEEMEASRAVLNEENQTGESKTTEGLIKQEQSDVVPDEESKMIYNIGDEASIKDWGLSVTDMQIAESISAGYVSFSPDEGNKYVQVFVTATNNGKQAQSFLPTFNLGDDISAKVIYGDGYEFTATNLLGYSNEMHDSTVNPLSSKSGEIVFTIPDSVASSEEELFIQFKAGGNIIKFKIR